MKAFLMHRDSDFELERELPANEQALTKDLELQTLCSAMSAGDPFLFEVARRALLLSLRDPHEIVYRQQVLTDCVANASVVRNLYALASEALKAEKSVWGGLLSETPRPMLSTSVQKMELLVGFLRRLREMTDEHAGGFRSPGFTRFFAMLAEELDEPYFELVENQLNALKFKSGMLLSAQLGAGNKGRRYILRRPREQGLLERMFDRSGHSFTVADRDENGFRALGELQDRGVVLVANALSQAVDHVKSFFVTLRVEIGFYVACLNLRERLAQKNEPMCLPVARPTDELALAAEGLYDVCLALTLDQPVVGNDIAADDKSLVMITGANQGGKSTLLRALGLAQLMAQCGMFAGAGSLRLNLCDGLFTHYKREEDEAMESGKLDEELSRMSEIADHITANCALLCNESFASTNEREGSQIARQVVTALLAERIKVVFVTHMFDLANSFYDQALDAALFLRAERGSEGARPFKLSEGKPLPTSYGEDSYRKMFGRSTGKSREMLAPVDKPL
jgi:DNA mismatch repair ATPase MutS